MLNNNLIEILSALNSKEIKELSDFVSSPYFNKNEGVVKLFQYLKNIHPAFNEQNVRKEKVFKKIFNGAEYNDLFMRSLTFKLNTIAENFITINDLLKKKTDFSINKADSLIERNLDKQGNKMIKETIEKLNSVKINNSDYYYNRYQLEELKDIIYSRAYTPLTVKDKPDKELMEESDNLIKFFLIGILKRYRYLINKTKTVQMELELELLEEILNYLKGKGKHLLDIIYLKILYKQVLLLLQPEKEELFDELKNLLTDMNIPIDKEERRDGLTVLNNYCIDKFYSGNEKYRLYIHELNVFEIEQNLYNRVKGGYFEPALFNNIVTIGLSLNKDEWVLNFIEKYHSKLSPEIKFNTYNFSLSKYYFKIKDFLKSLEHINKVKFDDIYHKFHSRVHLATLHYELGNYESLFYLSDSAQKFIINDKLLTKQHRTVSANFFKFVKILAKIKTGSSNEEPGLIKKKITECDEITYRKWLLNKADELINFRK